MISTKTRQQRSTSPGTRGSFLLAAALLCLSACGAGTTAQPPPAQVKQHPMLNRGGDAWAIPVQGTVGDGRAEGRSKRWRITVIWAGFGTDTSDDVCSSPDQVGERLFAATFHFNVQTSAGMPFTARASDFVLPDTSGRLYRTNAWADSLMFSLLRMKSGQSRDHYLSFRGLPKGENTYSLQLMQRNQRPVVIGTYHVVPNGKSPCPST